VTGAAAAVLTPALMRQWALAAAEALAEHAQQINDLNVFPVPDADTGTNSSLTFQAGLDAVDDLPGDADLATIARAMGRAAAFGARGNSGVILSQMLRGILDAAIDPGRPVDAAAMAQVLQSVAQAGREAVADPRDGTMLTVAADAAVAAGEAVAGGADLAAVCIAAADAARASLLDTPNHLAVLAEAGVVDAGGRAVVVVLDALAEVVAGQPRPQWQAPVLARTCDLTAMLAAYSGPAFEVMYVLRAGAAEVADLQSQLVNLGDSLAVVGGDGLWNVHVHVDDPAAAVAIGRTAGELHNPRITYLLPAQTESAALLVTGVDGELAALATQSGATVLVNEDPDGLRAEVADALARAGAGAAVLICHGAAATRSKHWWQQRVADCHLGVVACTFAPQVLAALAVHDPQQPFADDVAAMAAAAAAVRCAHITADGPRGGDNGRLAATTATWALPGWESGTSASVLEALAHVSSRLLAPQSEVVTVVLGPDAGVSAADAAALLAEAAPGCEVTVLASPVSGRTVTIGVE